MVLRQGLVAASLLAFVLPAYADPNDITLDLSGVVTSAINGTDNTFSVGQPVTGSITFDFSKEPFPPSPTGNPNQFLFQGIGNYSLTIGPDQLTTLTEVAFGVTDGGPGQADQLAMLDLTPFATNDPRNLFDDLEITLNDPDGTGFTAGNTTFDPSKFTAGTFAATGDPFFTGGDVSGPITAEVAGGRPVPEPSIALLLFTGIAGLIGWRCHAKAKVAATSLA